MEKLSAQRNPKDFITKKRHRNSSLDEKGKMKTKDKGKDKDTSRANTEISFSEKTIQTEFSEIKGASSHWKRIASENIIDILHKSKDYIFGNYPSFYYKRYLDTIQDKDSQFSIMKKEWFEGKSVLDIGCNEGVLTLLIAEHLNPKSIDGIDIDYRLVKNAIKNTKQLKRNSLCSEIVSSSALSTEEREVKTRSISKSQSQLEDPNINNVQQSLSSITAIKSIINEIKELPKSFQLTLANNSIVKGFNDNITSQIKGNIINSNIRFQQENYVSELKTVKSSYDTIVALSVIKWIHLNYGDIGVKVFFFNVYHQLNKGGLFIVEPQQWSSYKKSSKLSKQIYSNYKQIKLLPNSFIEYLQKVYEYKLIKTVVSPANSKKIYYRTIYVLQK